MHKQPITINMKLILHMMDALTYCGDTEIYAVILALIEEELSKQDNLKSKFIRQLLPFHGSDEEADFWEENRRAIIRECAESDIPEAQYLVGCEEYENRQYKKAVELYRKSAEKGYPPSLYCLGLAYYHGQGVESDKQKGLDFIKLAAGQLYGLALEYLIAYYKNNESEQSGKQLEFYSNLLSWSDVPFIAPRQR